MISLDFLIGDGSQCAIKVLFSLSLGTIRCNVVQTTKPALQSVPIAIPAFNIKCNHIVNNIGQTLSMCRPVDCRCRVYSVRVLVLIWNLLNDATQWILLLLLNLFSHFFESKYSVFYYNFNRTRSQKRFDSYLLPMNFSSPLFISPACSIWININYLTRQIGIYLNHLKKCCKKNNHNSKTSHFDCKNATINH